MIRMFDVQASGEGTIQLPDELFAALGGEKLKRLIFLIGENATVRVIPLTMSLDDIEGSVPALDRETSEDFDVEIEEAIEHALLEKYR